MLTHAPGLRRHAEGAPSDSGFTLVDGLVTEIEPARSAAGANDFHLMGRAEIIRQELRVGHVEERSISIRVVEPRSDCRPCEGIEGSVGSEPIPHSRSPREIDAGSDDPPDGRTQRSAISGLRAFVRVEL